VALEKQPQREIRVVALKENDHDTFWHYENTTPRRDREESSDTAKEQPATDFETTSLMHMMCPQVHYFFGEPQ
jgi:hypothetical protein